MTEIAALADLPALRPAAPIPPKFDPSAQPNALIGWTRFFASGANALEFWNERLYQQPIFMAPLVGQRMFYVNDAELVGEVLKTRTERYRKSALQDATINVVLGDGLLGSEGEVWRHDRKLMAPVFQPRGFGSFVPAMDREASRWVDQQLRASRDGRRAINVMRECSHLALRVIADILFGGLEGKQLATLSAATEAALARTRYIAGLFLLNPVKAANKPISELSSRRLNAMIDRLAAEFIERFRADPERYSETLLGRLINAADAQGEGFGGSRGEGADGAQNFVRDQIATMLLAGHETTAKTLAWAIYLLGFDPARATRLRESLAAGDDRYLSAFIDELLRLYPAAIIINREAAVDHELGGRQLKQGDAVMISPWLLGRNPTVWEQADLFRPERWLEAPLTALQKQMYIPFGTGARVCIGAALAKLELERFLRAIVPAWDIEIDAPERLMPQSAVTLSVTRPMWARISAPA